MKLNSTKDTLEKYNNTKVNLYYELAIKLEGELDQRIYKYDTLNEAIAAAYFIYLLTLKEGYDTIQDYKIFTTVKNGRNKVIIDDVTDNFHCWDVIDNTKIAKENEELRNKVQMYEEYLKSFNVTDKMINNYFKKEAV